MPKNLILGLSFDTINHHLATILSFQALLMKLNEKIKGGDQDLTQFRHHSWL